MAYGNDNSERTGAPSAAKARPLRQTSGGVATRERILASAERLFAERGFSGVSMPAIAAAAGITAGAIYKHFTSKEQLFFSIVRRAVEAAPTTQEGAGLAGPAALARIVAAYTTRRLKRVRQLAVEIHYAAAQDAQVRRLLRSSVDSEIGGMAARIAEAQARGEIDAGIDPRLTAAAIMSLIMGLMHAETLTPQLVGDAAWRAFIEASVEKLLSPAPAAAARGSP
jgi:TetR/AcrR family acrAB operon transcriptional repressor